MRRTVYYRVLAPLAGLLAASLSLLVVGLGANGLVCGPSWSTVASGEHLYKPRAIAAIASNDIWIVGSTKKNAAPIRTGAEHWDGSSWSRFPTPDVGTGGNALNGVDALASNNVWAVGYSAHKTLIERWDGTQWRVVTSPNAGTTEDENTLTSVDALSSTNAWAVGSTLTATSRRSLIQRWNGISWTIVPSPNPGSLSNSLLGVAAAGPNDIWAVGWKNSENSGDGLQSLLLHYDGMGWTEEGTVPKVGTGDNVLTGISVVSNDDVWATGYYVDGTQYKTLTLRYNGTTWNHVPSTNGADGTSILRGINAFSPTNAWAVGFEYRAALHRYVASTQHWDGSGWTAFPSATSTDGAKDREMFDVAKAPDTSQVWAVGHGGTGGPAADVETICPSGSSAATKTVQTAAQEGSGSPTESSAQAPEQPNSMLTEASGSSTSVAATSSGIPVRAVDKAADAGISETTRTYGSIIANFDNDTEPDIFLGRHGSLPRFYVNDGNGHFQETNRGTFAPTDRHGCDAADVSGDGLKDIFCTVGANDGTSAKRNELYIQQSDNIFAEKAGQYGVFDPFGRGRSAIFIEANDDSRPDLFVANNPTRGDGMPSPNRFFINQGNAFRYAPAYDLELETGLQGSKASVGDLDKDGWQDLLLNTPAGLRVYHNAQGKGFTEVSASVGLRQSPQDVTLADVNGDSWLDVVEVEPNELSVFVNTNGQFSSVFSTTLQYGFSVAAGDVNNDNRPDVYVMRGRDAAGTNAPDQVYLNGGDGASFTRMSSIPSTSQGEADSVAPIDYDGNGLTDFLVLNGGGEAGSLAGPVELIAFFQSTTPPPDTTAPRVESTLPQANATGVDPAADLTATFSEKLDPTTLTQATFKLFKVNNDGSTAQVTNVTVSLSADGLKGTLNPFGTSSTLLSKNTKYKAVVTTGATDLAGNRLDQNSTKTGSQTKQWFFTVGQ
jgi:hypothetical protein